MSSLTPSQQALLETELRQRQQEVQNRLAEHQGGLSRVEHARELLLQDADDLRHREAERERDHAQCERDTLDLAAACAALQRLRDGDYGRCADCDEDIPFPRLRAEPWALRCIDCESRRETAARRGL